MSKWIGGFFFAAAVCCWGQQIDFSSLDKLESKAKSVNRVNLDGSQLKAAANFVPKGEKDVPKDLVNNLQAVQVRNYEFDGPGKYNDTDLDAIRKQIAGLPGWTKIIESKENGEHSEIFMCSEEKGHGMAIISAEPAEVSVVFIKGPFNMGDLGKLHGLMGTPRVEKGERDRDRGRRDKAKE